MPSPTSLFSEPLGGSIFSEKLHHVFEQIGEVSTDVWVNDQPQKRKREEKSSDALAKKRRVARAGTSVPSGRTNNLNTIAQKPLDLGIATWNINHFNDAERKKEAIAWLFYRHRWLDVLILQEVNASAQKAVEGFISEANTKFDLGLKIAFGPLLQSLSSVKKLDVSEAGDDEDEGGSEDDSPELRAAESEGDLPAEPDADVEVKSLQIRSKKIEYQQISGKRSIRVKNRENLWVVARPGQREFYAVVYRNCTLTEAYALYSGQPETGYVCHGEQSEEEGGPGKPVEAQTHPLYWSKTADVPLMSGANADWKKTLDRGRMPKAFIERLQALGFRCHRNLGDERESDATDLKYVTRWKVRLYSSDEVIHVYAMATAEEKEEAKARKPKNQPKEESDGGKAEEKAPKKGSKVQVSKEVQAKRDAERTILLSWKTDLLPATRRPVVVYELQPQGNTRSVRLGVVHTTPAGSKLKRVDEFQQVKGAFEYGRDQNGPWIFGGDYYLDPEAEVESRQGKGQVSRRKFMFEQKSEELGYKIALAISGTNQSRAPLRGGRVAKNKTKFADRNERPNADGEPGTKWVVNKRADFFLCNPRFVFTDVGLVCPKGGILKIDPGHKALNWWSNISDHCPVGGVFCEVEFSRKWAQYVDPERSESEAYQKKLDELYGEVEENHDSAVEMLLRCQKEIEELCSEVETRWAQGIEPPELRFPGTFSFAEFSSLLWQIAATVLADYDFEYGLPQREYSVLWIRPSLSRVPVFVKAVETITAGNRYQAASALEWNLIQLASDLQTAVRLLGVSVGDFDITDEAEDYRDATLTIQHVPQGDQEMDEDEDEDEDPFG